MYDMWFNADWPMNDVLFLSGEGESDRLQTLHSYLSSNFRFYLQRKICLTYNTCLYVSYIMDIRNLRVLLCSVIP